MADGVLGASTLSYLRSVTAKSAPQEAHDYFFPNVGEAAALAGGASVVGSGSTPGQITISHHARIDARALAVPQCFDLGTFEDEQTASGCVWNNHDDADLIITSITSVGGTGISVSGLSISQEIKRTQAAEIGFTIEGSDAGTGAFTYELTITFQNQTTLASETCVICIEGTRLVPPTLNLANWAAPPKNTTAWTTRISRAESGVETRRARVRRPRRITEVFFQGFRDPRDSAAIEQRLYRIGNAQRPFPFFSDTAKVTIPVMSGDDVINCDTRWRRFFPGFQVYIAEAVPGRSLMGVQEIGTIAEVHDGFLRLTEPLANSFRKNAKVYPIITCRIVRNASLQIDDDYHSRVTLTMVEADGSTQLPALVAPGITESDDDAIQTFIDSWNTHEGLPIFDFPIDWGAAPPRATFIHDGNDSPVGLGVVQEVLGPRGHVNYDFTSLAMTRAKAWRTLQFFDWRGGSAFPYWFLSPKKDFNVVEMTESQAIVETNWTSPEWSFRPWLGFRMRDGRLFIREIDSVTRTGSQDVLSWTTAFPVGTFDGGALRHMTGARLCRFGSDEISEQWETLEHCRLGFSIHELTNEKDGDIEMTIIPTGEDDLTRATPGSPCV